MSEKGKEVEILHYKGLTYTYNDKSVKMMEEMLDFINERGTSMEEDLGAVVGLAAIMLRDQSRGDLGDLIMAVDTFADDLRRQICVMWRGGERPVRNEEPSEEVSE